MTNANQKLYNYILAICCILSLLSSGSGKGIYATPSNTVKEKSGLPTIERSIEVPKPTRDCDADCKTKELITLGIRSEIAIALVTNCKALTTDPVHCIKYGASIVKAESNGGKACRTSNKYNCSGLSVKDSYKSHNDGILHWIGKYNKYWYKANSTSFFYSVSGELPKSRYCTSEESSKSEKGCPNGLKHSTSFFNQLSF